MKLFDITGKVAIVTGGNGGIGLGMARGMASIGASIAVAGRNAEKARSALETLRGMGAKAEFIPVDVTKQDQCLRMVADALAVFGRVDILVNKMKFKQTKADQVVFVRELGKGKLIAGGHVDGGVVRDSRR